MKLSDIGINDTCNKIDASCVNADIELSVDPDNGTLDLTSSWADWKVDITPLVKLGETKTILKLAPEGKPTYLEYLGESGVPQCIDGADLARIIPMTKLADVTQSTSIMDGGVYEYNSAQKLFLPYNLKAEINSLESRLGSVENSVNNLNNRVGELETQTRATIARLNTAITRLDQEIHDRESAIADLQSKLDAETKARQDADNALQNKLNAETKARQDADNALAARVAALEKLTTKPSGTPSNAVLAWGNINAYGDKDNGNKHDSGLFTHDINANKANDLYFS